MKRFWLGKLQYICGEHNSHSHEEMLEASDGKSWINLNSQPLQVTQMHCIDKQ